MNKEEMLKNLDISRERFLEAIEDLDEEALCEAGITGDWSVKDILVHLSRWEAELVKMLWQVRQGQQPTSLQFTQMDVDQTNARWYAESNNRPLELVLEDFHGVRTQTMRRVEAFLDKELEEAGKYKFLKDRPLWEWIAGDTFEHEEEHLVELQAWKQKRRDAAA